MARLTSSALSGRVRSLSLLTGLALTVIILSGAESRDASARATGPGGAGRATVPVELGSVAFSLTPGSADTTTVSGRGQPALTALDTDIAAAPANTVIHLAPGRYAPISDFSARSGWVTVSGRGDSSSPVIDGARLWGAQYVRFTDVRFSAEVSVDHSPTLHYAQPAAHIALDNSTIDCGSAQTAPFTEGVGVRGGSLDIALSGDTIEHCVVGFGSIAQDQFSRRVSITHCTLQDFTGDAVDLGGLSGVTISHTIIAHIGDPRDEYHNDGIQFFGNVRNVSIVDNVLADSRNQLLLIQDAVPGTADHTSLNQNILVARNVIYGAGAVAVQDQGGDDVDFIQNTMWHNHYGSLWLLRSEDSGRSPVGTRIVGNLIQGLLFYEATATVESHDLIDGAQSHFPYGPGDLDGVDPDFVDPARGDFQLRADSPARAELSGAVLRRDLPRGTLAPVGVATTPRLSLGALQPGDGVTSAGAPLRASTFLNAP